MRPPRLRSPVRDDGLLHHRSDPGHRGTVRKAVHDPGALLIRIARLLLFLVVSLGAACFLGATAWALTGPNRHRYRAAAQFRWAQAVRTILGMRVDVRGEPPAGGPFLVVSNHLGYLDIAVLAGILRPVAFVSKADVSRWPLIGFIARAGGTIFVSRENRTQVRDFIDASRRRLDAGVHVVVFPEGTSSRGETVLPFKTAAFASVAAVPGSAILPVRIDLLEVGGRAAAGGVRDIACWHGDMEFAPHFWNLLGSGGTRFRVSIGAAVDAGAVGRKSLAGIAHDRVAALGSCGRTARQEQVPIRSRDNI